MFIVLIRTIILYSLVVLVIRLMGKSQIGELQPYELVITIMISDLASLPMQDTRLPLLLGIIPIITLLMVKTILSELQQKSPFIRKLIDGAPCILIKDGKINLKTLKNQRININDIMEELRLNGYFNISDIQYAILENNGQISIIPKIKKQPVSKEDLKIQAQEEQLPILLLLNGKLINKSFQKINKDEAWFDKFLQEEKAPTRNELYIAMLDSNGKLFYQSKNEIENLDEYLT
ncbi:Uncharacterized membrane protein YcaP, DUF421 family [Clostridium cavendishii DSM 21758]|uniref:Uncharacterized membrane protein YcaP, DUF421 family n=1 Tax=Clostridium cavendishii DSM 21758 TaxID=1121302 RepID=A0A1M6MWL4_9CLOT|nr:DUF421 domain-containing protein [Clostridium cavendishii]SHJ87824.1 Uncharacterized membrane protein YcaP, DUF421 family [Clostridium cavendishii DSM 21758]